MFEQILEHMQRDAVQKTRAAVSQVFYNRWLSILYIIFLRSSQLCLASPAWWLHTQQQTYTPNTAFY